MSLRPAFVISRPLVPWAEDWKRSRVRFRRRLAAALRSGSVPKIVAAPALHFLRPPTADRSGLQIQFLIVVQLLKQPCAMAAYAAR
jgi:hypothetical protein